MCGLVALFSNDKIETPENAVRAALARMRARGPDAEGVWSDDGVVLGHRRLAILDLDARANQPMRSVDGRYAIVFNGEIYNFRELRRELEAEGAVFQTSSDTEVVLTLFAREGEAMLPRLRGMFAFVIWDRVSRCAFAARDPYGIKPLYYAQTKQGLAFASQVKALLASGLVEQDCEPAGLAGFYLWGSVPERGYRVVLSGVGGDELFRGYSLFDQLPRQAATGRALASIPGARPLMTWPCALLACMRAQPKLRGVPDFMGSLAGMYFLRRCLFLPDELPGLMGADRAHEGLARLGGKPPGMSAELASDAGNEVGLLESTHYLRNQLLRDADWASMDHSLELRTPLVDARLLDTLSPYLPAFAGGAGKALLAGAPQKALPAEIVNRPKTGFSLPMTAWLSDPSGILADRRLVPPGMARAHWSRRWACAILARAESCG